MMADDGQVDTHPACLPRRVTLRLPVRRQPRVSAQGMSMYREIHSRCMVTWQVPNSIISLPSPCMYATYFICLCCLTPHLQLASPGQLQSPSPRGPQSTPSFPSVPSVSGLQLPTTGSSSRRADMLLPGLGRVTWLRWTPGFCCSWTRSKLLGSGRDVCGQCPLDGLDPGTE